MTEISTMTTLIPQTNDATNTMFSFLPDMIIRIIFEWVEKDTNWILKYDHTTRKLQYKINMKKVVRDFDDYTVNIDEILHRRLYWVPKQVNVVIYGENCPGMEYTLTKIDDKFYGGKIIEQYIVFQRNDRDEYIRTLGALEYSDDDITTPQYWFSATYYSHGEANQLLFRDDRLFPDNSQPRKLVPSSGVPLYKRRCSISHDPEHTGENYLHDMTRIVSVVVPAFTLEQMHEFKQRANELGDTGVDEIDLDLYRQFDITHYDYYTVILPGMNEINNTAYSFDFCVSQIARMEFNPHLNVYEEKKK